MEIGLTSTNGPIRLSMSMIESCCSSLYTQIWMQMVYMSRNARYFVQSVGCLPSDFTYITGKLEQCNILLPQLGDRASSLCDKNCTQLVHLKVFFVGGRGEWNFVFIVVLSVALKKFLVNPLIKPLIQEICGKWCKFYFAIVWIFSAYFNWLFFPSVLDSQISHVLLPKQKHLHLQFSPEKSLEKIISFQWS
jgi:hypothetical protein